jgi:lipopolysaccharide export system permease protein
MLRTQRSYSNRKFSITVRRVEGKTLIQPTMSLQPQGGQPALTATAQSGELRVNPDRNTLTIILRNGTADMGADMHVSFLGSTIEREIPLPQANDTDTSDTSPSQLAMRVIPEEKIAQRERIKALQRQNAAEAALEMMTGDFDALCAERWNAKHNTIRNANYRLCRLHTEPHRRWANGFSCLCFVLVGAPLAIRLRNSDFLTSFFLCFLPILLAYYPLIAFGVDRAKTGSLPPYTVWSGNLILVLCGLWLLRKVHRY